MQPNRHSNKRPAESSYSAGSAQAGKRQRTQDDLVSRSLQATDNDDSLVFERDRKCQSAIQYAGDPITITQVEKLLESYKSSVSAHKEWMRNNRPPVDLGQLLNMLPKDPTEFGEEYSAEDEARLQEEWKNDPLTPYRLGQSLDAKMTNLWKIPQRLWPGTFADNIISDRYYLAFEPEPGHKIKVNGQEVPHPNWSGQFCDALSDLLGHPLWLESLETLTLSIQYAVICRTGDQRKDQWPQWNATDSKFLDTFMSVTSQQQDGSRSIVDLHAVTRQRSGDVPSVMSRLFLEIERLAYKGQVLTEDEATGPYKVRIADLKNLATALDRVSSLGYAIFLPVQFHSSVLKGVRGQNETPVRNDLASCRRSVLLDIKRSEIKAQKSAGLFADPSPLSRSQVPALSASQLLCPLPRDQLSASPVSTQQFPQAQFVVPQHSAAHVQGTPGTATGLAAHPFMTKASKVGTKTNPPVGLRVQGENSFSVPQPPIFKASMAAQTALVLDTFKPGVDEDIADMLEDHLYPDTGRSRRASREKIVL
ncbi:hypothetical protein BKA67DRAFT_656741 [Truncatella angustata]|uniref:Uncharacterized protein n=1 Tax=Truncatella angustata TaxID=152316 RepID=A0A9P8UUR0_9PEZI|nr:uncharacterized protein BKA67DRAFT_656741 [Truncatella angustata]KAH6658554.1 hypothetical protein BKA67DRAFT_656741 [Truncatella angustata]